MELLVKSLCLTTFFLGGNTSNDDNPKRDGDDGTSFVGPGELFISPLKGNKEEMYFLFNKYAAFGGCS